MRGSIAALTAPAVCSHAHAKGAALMKAIGFMRVVVGVAVVSSLLLGGVPARAGVLEQTKKIAGRHRQL